MSVHSFPCLVRLRETRLTAVLGFLVSRFPEEFGPLLGFRHLPADEISVEETDAGDRYDVLIRQSGETHIIEGKIGPTQRVDQLLRYVRSVRRTRGRRPALTVVDDGSEFSQSRQSAFQQVNRHVKSLRFVTWSQVAEVCHGITGKRRFINADSTGTVIAQEMATHLKENNMTTEAQPEIYLRDVSDTTSVRSISDTISISRKANSTTRHDEICTSPRISPERWPTRSVRTIWCPSGKASRLCPASKKCK